MSEEKKKEISGVQIDEIVSQNPKTRIKSYLRLILLFLVLFGVLFIVGSFVPEFLVLFVFLLLMSAPVIILLRNRISGILPDFISNSLMEIDNRNEEEKKQNYNVSLYYKQVLSIIFSFLLFVGGINYLRQFIKQYTEKKSIIKFLASFVCITLGGLTALELENL